MEITKHHRDAGTKHGKRRLHDTTTPWSSCSNVINKNTEKKTMSHKPHAQQASGTLHGSIIGRGRILSFREGHLLHNACAFSRSISCGSSPRVATCRFHTPPGYTAVKLCIKAASGQVKTRNKTPKKLMQRVRVTHTKTSLGNEQG